jgi:hypothetical protein
VDTFDLLRLILARDAAAPPAADRWDAATWDAVHRAVLAWDAAPLAFAAVRGARLAEHVPPGLLAEWRRDHLATTAVNLRLAFEAEHLVDALASRGAAAVSLKGTALFHLGVWRDPGARPTCDVDLLIRPEDGALVASVLGARGYVQTRAGGSKHWPPFVREGLAVEVHEHAFWSLADGHRVRLSEMVDAAGEPALGPAVAHLVHHLFESSVTTPWLAVKTLADLAEVRAFVERRAASEPDVAASVAASCRRFGLGRRLGALAGLLGRVIDRPVPAAWTAETRAADVDRLLGRCAPDTGSRVEALRILDRTAAFSRMPIQEKAALLRHHLAPPAEAMRAIYGLPPGSPWVWPLYPLRPLHLVGRSVVDAARLLLDKRPLGSGRSRPP